MSVQVEKDATFQHIAISVSNLEQSVAFYSQIFGFRVVLEMNFSDEVIGSIIGYPRAICRMIQLEKEERMIELFQYSNPRGQPIPSTRTQADIGFSHICFIVGDIDTVKKKLIRQGMAALMGYKVEVRTGVFIQYCLGPDGEAIELKEIKSRDRS
ncbi:MAG: VOC family protein [Planctomycetes bacterium]|nr:VOC family protein [Planctomycetota bacterium]